MSSRTIFFSYSRKDSEFALDLGNKLREAGANIWLDQLDIRPGTNWDDSIEKALHNSDWLLVLLSKTSVNSKNVSDEYSFALEEGKNVVPILLEPCDIPFRLRRLQYADFSTDPDQGIKTLINALDLDQEIASKLSVNKNSLKNPTLRNVKTNSTNKPKTRSIIIGVITILAVAFGIIKLGFFKGENNSRYQLTVLVHSEEGKDRLVLPNRGQVKLIYGDANVVETINVKGEATFKQIPSMFFEDGATVEIIFMDPQGEPYKAVQSDSMYSIANIDYIALAVKLFGLDRVHGIVKHHTTGDPLTGVRITIAGIETFTNEYGEFEINIPVGKQQKFQSIRVFKEGFELYELQNIPIQTNRELPINLKPKS